MLSKILTGGFLKGYRTYILGALLVAQAAASYAVGDLSFQAFTDQLPELLAGLGLWTARASAPTA